MPDYQSGKFRIKRGSSYCALPVIGDTYRNCAGRCLYCFEIQCNNQHLRNRKITPIDYRSLFNSLYDDPVIAWYREEYNVPLQIGVLADPFTPAENKYKNTYNLLKLLARAGVPAIFTTKRPDVINEHHIALLKELPKAMIRCSFGTTDDAIAKELEPGVIPPSERFRHLKRLSDAGIEVGVRFEPFFHTLNYDYAAAAACGASNVTTVFLSFSALWRHSTDPHLWEVLSGQTFPGGDVSKKGTPARQWVEAREKEYFAPLQSLDKHPYLAPGNLWVYYDPFKVREMWQRERARAHEHGLKYGICCFGAGIHNIDLNDAPCACLTEGWGYDPGSLVPQWHTDKWATYIIPDVYDYPRDEAMARFLIANSEWNRPIALDDDPDLQRLGIAEESEVEPEGSSTRGLKYHHIG